MGNRAAPKQMWQPNAQKTLIKLLHTEMAETDHSGVQLEHFQESETSLEHKVTLCGIPQAWYGAGLLSLWSKGRVGSNPTSRAKLLFLIKA